MICPLCRRHNKVNAIVLISAQGEWDVVKDYYHPTEISSSPYGDWFIMDIEDNRNVMFFQSGWGKISASGSTQYVIDQWNPEVLINLGTCGGFEGEIQKGDIIVVNKTITYDILEQMGDSQAAIDHFSSKLKTISLEKIEGLRWREHLMISADQDIVAKKVPFLKTQFHAIAADWESSSIAFIANKNQKDIYILRGVSDIVRETGSEAYGNLSNFQAGAKLVMTTLLDILPHILKQIKSQNLRPESE